MTPEDAKRIRQARWRWKRKYRVVHYQQRSRNKDKLFIMARNFRDVIQSFIDCFSNILIK